MRLMAVNGLHQIVHAFALDGNGLNDWWNPQPLVCTRGGRGRRVMMVAGIRPLAR